MVIGIAIWNSLLPWFSPPSRSPTKHTHTHREQRTNETKQKLLSTTLKYVYV